jgi:hypothetical protein
LVNTAWNEAFDVDGGGGSHGFDPVEPKNGYNKPIEDLQASTDKMENTATDLSKSTDYQSDATTKMTTAALGLMNLPVEVANAVINGMSGIVFTLDGTAITNYINQRLGQEINLARK